MDVVVATTTVPFADGGASLLAEWLRDELVQREHNVELLTIPFDASYRKIPSQTIGLRMTDLGDRGDRLIALRYPSYVLRHSQKVTWFLHHHRPAFDMWGTEYQDVPANARGIGYREFMCSADTLGLAESRHLFANSEICRRRLRVFNDLDATVLYPPVHDPARYYTESYGDFIFYPSRLTRHKRQYLCIEALQYTTTPIRLVIAGAPDPPGYENELMRLAQDLGVDDRVELLPRFISEEKKVQLFATCRAVAYTPLDEDSYGYPSLEAHHANKGVVTCSDSGGTSELIIDDDNGIVVEPDPRQLAGAFDRLYDDRDMAFRLGTRGAERINELGINWDSVIERLLS